MSENIITQVSQDNYHNVGHYEEDGGIDYNSKIHLNIRGVKFTIRRDELMSLPESILLCLFPNGVFLDANGQVITNLTEEDVVYVNFDPHCFQYILYVFGDAQNDLEKGSSLSPQSSRNNHQVDPMHALNNKPAIIVLREDLDYYVIPPVAGLNEEAMRFLKLEVSDQLVKNKYVFSGLGYDVDKPEHDQTLGPAEKHLFEMLCTSGFEPTSLWGSRSMEPSKCMLLSLLLVRLSNNTNNDQTPPDSPSLAPVASNASTASRSRSKIAHLASSASRAASRSLSRRRPDNNHNKLLLFWRKPARKCWWSHDAVTVQVKSPELFKNVHGNTMSVTVHMRRVWTLELSVIGIQ